MDATQIRELRESRVLSQEALARSLGVAVRTVARWESGAFKPSPMAVEKLRLVLANNRMPEGEVKKGEQIWL
jgi:DNA-binding transcriptional regulator YiaG